MRRKPLVVDAGLAVVVATLVLVISPGVAVTGMIALALLVACTASFGLHRRSVRTRPARRPSRRRG